METSAGRRDAGTSKCDEAGNRNRFDVRTSDEVPAMTDLTRVLQLLPQAHPAPEEVRRGGLMRSWGN
jgi:hypothetical protein